MAAIGYTKMLLKLLANSAKNYSEKKIKNKQTKRVDVVRAGPLFRILLLDQWWDVLTHGHPILRRICVYIISNSCLPPTTTKTRAAATTSNVLLKLYYCDKLCRVTTNTPWTFLDVLLFKRINPWEFTLIVIF